MKTTTSNSKTLSARVIQLKVFRVKTQKEVYLTLFNSHFGHNFSPPNPRFFWVAKVLQHNYSWEERDVSLNARTDLEQGPDIPDGLKTIVLFLEPSAIIKYEKNTRNANEKVMSPSQLHVNIMIMALNLPQRL